MKYKANSYKAKELKAYMRGINMGMMIGLIGIIILGMGNIIIAKGF